MGTSQTRARLTLPEARGSAAQGLDPGKAHGGPGRNYCLLFLGPLKYRSAPRFSSVSSFPLSQNVDWGRGQVEITSGNTLR